MARLAKILKTDVMADLDMKALAQVLRAQGRGRDTVLAHITPAEARKLKRDGGSGTINPATGLPEFQEMYDFGADYGGAESFGDTTAAVPAAEAAQEYADPSSYWPTEVGGGQGGAAAETLRSISQGTYTPTVAVGPTPGSQPPAAASLTPNLGGLDPLAAERAAAGSVAGLPKPSEPGYFDRLGTSLQKQLEDPATLARLGLGLGTGALGLLQQQRAAAGAKQSKREMANIGAPYRAQGQELIEQARRGEMSPASMQAYQAAQAQIAQQTARQGGVGAAQGAATLERLRAQLLQNQYNLGLNVANIGDRYLAGAIQTGQQANQQLMTATNQFYSTLGSMLSGPTGQAVATAVRP
jgi:hypothetical protein